MSCEAAKMNIDPLIVFNTQGVFKVDNTDMNSKIKSKCKRRHVTYRIMFIFYVTAINNIKMDIC